MDNKELTKLIKEHKPFVIQTAKKFEWSGIDLDDLIQEGMIGLMHAAKLFDDSKDVKFLTYASHWIKQKIRRYVQRNEKHQQYDEIFDYIDFQVSSPTVTEENVIVEDFKNQTVAILRKNGELDRDINILLARYLNNNSKTLEELGEQYNITRQRVQQIEEKMVHLFKTLVLPKVEVSNDKL